jgi:hypothetical protein
MSQLKFLLVSLTIAFVFVSSLRMSLVAPASCFISTCFLLFILPAIASCASLSSSWLKNYAYSDSEEVGDGTVTRYTDFEDTRTNRIELRQELVVEYCGCLFPFLSLPFLH